MAVSISRLRPAGRRAAASGPAGEMPLVGHLAELRRRLVTAVVALAAGAVAVFAVFARVLQLLLDPYCQAVGPGHACSLYVTGPLDGLTIRVEVAAYGGLLLALPVVLWQAWRFVVPALRPGERRYAASFVTSSVVLFAGGGGVAYAIFPHALRWLDAAGGPSLHQIYSPSGYLGLLLLMMVAFGVTFELPVVLVFLQLVGAVTPARLSSWRRWAIVGLVALAAVVTPSSDPFSMLALAVPLLVFYEVAIVLGRLLTRRRRIPAAAGSAGGPAGRRPPVTAR